MPTVYYTCMGLEYGICHTIGIKQLHNYEITHEVTNTDKCYYYMILKQCTALLKAITQLLISLCVVASKASLTISVCILATAMDSGNSPGLFLV